MADSQLLAPWEYEGEVPQVVDDGEISDEGRRVRYELLRPDASFDRIVFRPEGEDGSWSVSLLLRGTTQKEAEEHVIRALKRGLFVRQFRFGGEKMLIRRNGVGFWYTDPLQGETSEFCLGKRITRQTSSQTYNWVTQLLARPSSDVSFARRFSHCDADQKSCCLFGFSAVEELLRARAELNAVCRLVLYARTDVWIHTSKLHWVFYAPCGREPAHFLLAARVIKHEGSNLYFDKWATVLDLYGPFHAQTHRMCLREYFCRSSILAQQRLDAPTAHEQLESRFLLREWIRQHVPSNEWTELERFED